jgi:hypothetical protein
MAVTIQQPTKPDKLLKIDFRAHDSSRESLFDSVRPVVIFLNL